MPEPQTKRPFVTHYGGLRDGYCASLDNAVVAAVRYCVTNHARRCNIETRTGGRVADISITPMGALLTLHGAHRLTVDGYRHLKRVA